MAVWSSTVRGVGQNTLRFLTILPKNVADNGQIRTMAGHGPRLFPLQPSRWQWNKTKDLLHFYAMVGLIPAGIMIFSANVFIGPATLQPTPEGYVPKHWEYHRHPISRFLSRYIYASPQQNYEKVLHVMKEESDKMKVRKLEKQIHELMSKRNDYKAYYYRPVIANYHRQGREVSKELLELRGN